MKKFILCSLLFAFFASGTVRAADEKFISCGPGFILIDKGKTDGIATSECQKLWCRDLENGKAMGAGDRANSGYKTTNAPLELCDAGYKCIECFGDRNWCKGETSGVWNPEFGAYTKKGDDSNAFLSLQKGGCFSWSIQKPKCENEGEVAILVNDKFVCAAAGGTAESIRKSSIRRTGTIRVK
ncbi:MAG: hypothetical protein LBK26_02740 [Rickettsiales bacterium]|jgi:hypothetical protein|nr:hypothetical protein [Rickettsiales bacterium]